MSKVYKIHPAIGVARVGNHLSAFFVGPESPGSPGVEIAPDGTESPVTRYKDGGLIKRQAARFRVYEYESDGPDGLTLVGEVTSAQASIEWRVDLVNRKAALDRNPAAGHPAAPRNVDIIDDRDRLIIRDQRQRTISGTGQTGVEFQGKFLGKDVYLGELQTDGAGRLLVLGGRGTSASVPPDEPIFSFANNDLWHDDVSDGPVTATLTFPAQDPITVHHPAWVVVGPPDYAPGVGGIITLYDVAFQAAIAAGMLVREPRPSFRRHIKPLIERAAGLRWTNNWNRWNAPQFPVDMGTLADTGPGAEATRLRVGSRLKMPPLRNFVVPAFLSTYIDQWVAGDFLSDLDQDDTPPTESEALDRAALEACVGGNFFPGIEASINLNDKDLYAEPFRLNHASVAKVYPGCLSEIMAVPWQADFVECDMGEWWPSQRPDIAMLDPNEIPGSAAGWANPLSVTDHEGMIEHWKDFGFVVPTQIGGETVFIEADRDPGFPRE